jgi:hypothetical protein
MKVYVWILELAAAGALFLLVRWILGKVKERKADAAHSVRKQGSAVSRAERDRKDIEALTRGIADPPRIPGTESAKAGAARQERGRRAASHSSFDPDMPARDAPPPTKS